jgi:hypothetical protein
MYPIGLQSESSLLVAVNLQTHFRNIRFVSLSHVTSYNGGRIKTDNIQNMRFPLHSPLSFLTKAYAGEQKDMAVKQHRGSGEVLTVDTVI